MLTKQKFVDQSIYLFILTNSNLKEIYFKIILFIYYIILYYIILYYLLYYFLFYYFSTLSNF